MKRAVALLALLLVAGGVWWVLQWRNRPPEVEFAKVTRETIADLLSTNGKLEPVDWTSVRTEVPGIVTTVSAAKGRDVAAGATLVEIETREAKAALSSARARIDQVKAELEALNAGGRSAEISTIDAQLAGARQEQQSAQREVSELERLVEKKAATAYELSQAKQRLDAARIQVEGLQRRRGSLVAPADRSAADARLKDAESAARLAEQQIALGTVRAPRAGFVYQFDVRAGDYVAAGTQVAAIGRVDRLRALIYVDEPELGRVEIGKQVTITWDAKPGREWHGVVDKKPPQISTLGTRQVGEVQCLIENPDKDLLPGANVNALIRVSIVEGATAVPKSALRREGGIPGVYVLEGETIAWRPLKMGISSLVKAQVIDGLKEGDAVALPTERALKTGLRVTPIIK